MSSSSDSSDSFDEIPTLAEMMVRPPCPPSPSYADKVRGTPPVADAKFQEPSGSKKNPPESQKPAAPVAGGVSSKKKSSEKKKPDAPVPGGVASKKNPPESQKPATPVAGGVASKKKSSEKKKREVDLFSHPSHPPPHKKEKKIREKLGLPDLEMALSQAEMALSQASLTSHTTSFSFLQATVERAKEEIKKRDATIKLLETSSGILTKYVSPSLYDKSVYLGKTSPSSEFKTKHLKLHYLNILPQHLRSKDEEDEIDELMIFFNEQKEAGNVEGGPCGLKKMWILPVKKRSTFIHSIKSNNMEFSEFKDIKCKGESPSMKEGATALLSGRRQDKKSKKRVDSTFFGDDEYLINVSKDVCEHCFGVLLNSNAAMWITSSGVCIYAYKNERDSLMLFTKGTQSRSKGYDSCQISKSIVQCNANLHPSMVHRVMMMANSPIFDPKQWILWEVDHIDQNSLHNDIMNLRWVLQLTNKANYHGTKGFTKTRA